MSGRCENCGLPMHRYGCPSDADGHEPTQTACLNSLQQAHGELVAFVRRVHNEAARSHLARAAEKVLSRW